MEERIEIPILISLQEEELFADFGEITVIHHGDLPIYDGEYIVTPKAFEEQILETENKAMRDNVVVLEIPYTEVSNPSGGTTVSIG